MWKKTGFKDAAKAKSNRAADEQKRAHQVARTRDLRI
jgi:hypothetical protein